MSLKKKLLSPIIWGNLLVMALAVVALSIGLWVGLDKYTHHGEEIMVPDVEGKLIGDAEYTLEMLDLVAVVVDSTYNRQLPSGAVMLQQPKGGSKVKSGREIYLTINSRESPTVGLPDIADNCSMRDAQSKLQAMGFQLADPEYIPGEREWVYGIKCQGRQLASGDRVSIETPLTLLIGNGQYGSDEEINYTEPEPEYADEELDEEDEFVETTEEAEHHEEKEWSGEVHSEVVE